MILLAVAGCGDRQSADAMFQNYLYRLGNVTKINEPEPPSLDSLPLFPKKREILLSTENFRVGLLDFLDLKECNLIQEVGQRNSGLGRVQTTSSRLLYEIIFYRKIRFCSASLDQKKELSPTFGKKITAILDHKTQILPISYWNATIAGPEFRIFASTHTKAPKRDEKIDTVAIENALNYLSAIGHRLKSIQNPPNTDQIEQHLKYLQRDKALGKLLQGLHLSEYYLGRATQILERAASRNKICPFRKKTRQGKFLWNVFMQFYICEVQAYLTTIHQPSRTIIFAADRLIRSQSVPRPRIFDDFYQALLNPNRANSLWQRYNTQLGAHTAAWQTLLQQCQLMPKLNNRYNATSPEELPN